MTANLPILKVQVLPHGEGLDLPAYETALSAGMDLRAAVDAPVLVESMERRAIPTGLAMAIPAGFEGQVRPRSGLALRRGLSMPNSPGTIDADYRGELKVLVINLGSEPIEITRGMRIAQLLICPVAQAQITLVDDLDSTVRGTGGFGSTGLS
jgi:dUTP pyrophosphatase